MLIDYKSIIRISPIFYGAFILLLIAVLFTTPINGATSWFDIGFFSFQPAEFAKVFVILFLAYVITKIQERDKKDINKPVKLLIVFAILAVPVLLIIKQPDYGTAAAFLVAIVFMLITAGIDKKYIIGSIFLVVVSVPLIYNFVLPEHAKQRIDIFLNPESDPRGAGYNIIQSKLAIRSRRINRDGTIKRKSNTIRIFISKNN
jgi:rod shape determining protein RodA